MTRRRWLSLLLSLAALPVGWPQHFALGLTDRPGDAAALHRHAPLDLRYQYLAGGVNTGAGWATWNPGNVRMAAGRERRAQRAPQANSPGECARGGRA